MKSKFCICSHHNYLTFRTAIEAEILFAVCVIKKQALTGGKILACEDKCSKKIGAESAVFNFVFFVMLKNKIEQSAAQRCLNKKLSLSKIPTDRTFENRRSRYKELGKKVPQAYRVYVEDTFLPCDAVDARIFSKEETGLYYYGARYLDPKYSRWLSGEPALGEYVPKAPIDDEVKKHNENLPGMVGVFNVVNLHVYHYAGNNPIKYTDPDGREDKSSKDFIGYTMGYTVANIIKHAKISFSSNNRGYSFPWGSIGIPKNDSYQGGYNPDYYTTYQSTEIGRIGLEAHELWHQYQYATDPMAFDKLIIEQAEYFLGIKDPYIW